MKQLMTVDYMFRLGQHYLLDERLDFAEKLLRLASEKGHEEATWLISLMDNTPSVRSNGIDADSSSSRLYSMFKNSGDDIRSLSYRLWFMDGFGMVNDSDDLDAYFNDDLAKSAADSGNAVAQYNYYLALYQTGDDDYLTNLAYPYLEKAAAQDLLMAIEELARILGRQCTTNNFTDRHMQLYLRGAELGEFNCMKKISHTRRDVGYMDSRISTANHIVALNWLYRSYIWGDRSTTFSETFDRLESYITHIDLNDPICVRSVQVYFNAGRELAGYDEFFPRFDQEEHDAVQPAIKFYMKIVDAAKISALCTYWIFKPILARDVATVIAKMVYESRSDPLIWVRAN